MTRHLLPNPAAAVAMGTVACTIARAELLLASLRMEVELDKAKRVGGDGGGLSNVGGSTEEPESARLPLAPV